MNYAQELKTRATAHSEAVGKAAILEARRDELIREAHRVGGLTTRDIAGVVGLSFQRVAVILGGDRDRPLRATLHQAMEQVLTEAQGEWVPVHEVAKTIHARELYQRRDRGVIPPGQIRARAAKYPQLFEGSSDGSNRIRLRRAA